MPSQPVSQHRTPSWIPETPDVVMTDASPEREPPSASLPPQPQKRPKRLSGWDVRPATPELEQQPTPPREHVVHSRAPSEMIQPQTDAKLVNQPDAPDCDDLAFVVEEHEVSDPVTIPSRPATPQPWSSDAGITSSRSRNHYSNGDSRLTPEFEWNGWENVCREKLPRHHDSRPRLQPDPSPPSESDEEITSPLAIDMEIDSGNLTHPKEASPSFPEGYIPLELPPARGCPSRATSETEAQSSRPNPRLTPSVEPPDTALASGAGLPTATKDPAHTSPTLAGSQANRSMPIRSPSMEKEHPASSSSHPVASNASTCTTPPDAPAEEEAFEDATPQLPEPSSPPAPPSLSIAAQSQPQCRTDEDTSPRAGRGSIPSGLDLGSGSIRSLRAAARLRTSNTTQVDPAPNPTPSR